MRKSITFVLLVESGICLFIFLSPFCRSTTDLYEARIGERKFSRLRPRLSWCDGIRGRQWITAVWNLHSLHLRSRRPRGILQPHQAATERKRITCICSWRWENNGGTRATHNSPPRRNGTHGGVNARFLRFTISKLHDNKYLTVILQTGRRTGDGRDRRGQGRAHVHSLAFFSLSALYRIRLTRRNSPRNLLSHLVHSLPYIRTTNAWHASSITTLERWWKSHVAAAGRLEDTAGTSDNIHRDWTRRSTRIVAY